MNPSAKNNSNPVVCRPTPWFYWRALAMLLMFSGFAAYFAYDASIGYPIKNLQFFTHKQFSQLGQAFSENFRQTPDQWKEYASQHHLALPDDYPLPPQVSANTPVPETLLNPQRLDKEGWHALWLEYTAERGWPASPAESPYSHAKIREQWIACSACSILAILVLAILIRTALRRMSFDGQTLTAGGKSLAVDQIRQIDLRKWKSKGLAFAISDSSRLRIDGMVYGGFSGPDGGPAEQLMRQLLASFSGEIIDYSEPEPTPAASE